MTFFKAKFSWKHKLGLLLILIFALYTAKASVCLVKYKCLSWFPRYVSSSVFGGEKVPDKDKHLIFIMVDHFEPGKGEKGSRFAAAWLSKFRKIADKHRDSYGNKFRYTWFYPYDHHNGKVLGQLSEMAYKGYGEVEMHWHRPPATNETFPQMLDDAIKWYRIYGALKSSVPPCSTHFAYVAGNWELDNCRGESGVNNDIAILFSRGCYADFTFSTIGTDCQPRTVNSLYYVKDEPNFPKSYDLGVEAEVGKPVNDRLMIFEGPIAFIWRTAGLEYGAVEDYQIPNDERIKRWIDTNIHVKGRPEWVFVKVYSHGCQSAKTILNYYMEPMLEGLENICKKRKIKLHYMTAREAYNVVKAAEDGKVDDPERYRDHKIPKPWNMVFRTQVPIHQQ